MLIKMEDLTIDEILTLDSDKPKKWKHRKKADHPSKNKQVCHKCLGKGQILHYTHYKLGRCFTCNGRGHL